MSGKTQPDGDTNGEHAYPEFLPQSPILSSGKTLWDGISLDQMLLPPGETPEYSLEEFVITINLGQGFQVERVMNQHSQTGLMLPRSIALCPIQTTQVIRWNRDAHVLSLYLRPELLTRHAIEVLDTDQFELIPHLLIQDELIYQVGLGLSKQLETYGVHSRLYAESATTFLAIHLLQTYAAQTFVVSQYEGGLPQQKLKQAIEYIQDHLDQDISVNELAAHLGISRYYFCRLFKQSTGLSPYQYVIQQRIAQAKQLLLQGKMSISDVAIACGFAHQSHLNRHFKRLTGITPKTLLKS
ncbi:helix-turn-helix domain-containing protein [Pantanalinema rosaneae]|uniref:helix-turn-helix domain-containing protein n=1 Tax=Pantanalinema rosaneae TaxID=1620701 RepID=UPI003D6E15CE